MISKISPKKSNSKLFCKKKTICHLVDFASLPTFTSSKFNVSKITRPDRGQVVFARKHAISPSATSLHWLINRPSLPYRNHEMYESHLKYSGTDPEFRKKPPNSRNGMMIGGPTDRAIAVDELAHEIR